MWKALYLQLGGLGGREGISFLKEGVGIQPYCLMCCLVAGSFSVLLWVSDASSTEQ